MNHAPHLKKSNEVEEIRESMYAGDKSSSYNSMNRDKSDYSIDLVELNNKKKLLMLAMLFLFFNLFMSTSSDFELMIILIIKVSIAYFAGRTYFQLKADTTSSIVVGVLSLFSMIDIIIVLFVTYQVHIKIKEESCH